MTATLHLGDCLDFMRGLPDGSVDAVITDPPYGLGESNRRAISRGNLAAPIDYGEFTWDEKIDREAIEEMRRVSKRQVIWGGNYYADWLPPSSCWLVWDKLNGNNDFADCELAWTNSPTAVRRLRYLWNGMMKQKPEQRYHPTQKPLAVMEWAIDGYTQPGDTVLDPFMGSGTTGVACVKLGRNFIGCEIDPAYFAIAERRIREAELQPALFQVDNAH